MMNEVAGGDEVEGCGMGERGGGIVIIILGVVLLRILLPLW